ncbi:MAG: hypothetical protein V1873_06565 [Verrucomicrobiota bacterium]
MKTDPHQQDEIYRMVGEEVARKEYHPGPMARAVEEGRGDRDLVQGLYIKFRVEELARQAVMEAERAVQEWAEYEDANGRKRGPVSVEELRVLCHRGTIHEHSLVYPSGGVYPLFLRDFLQKVDPRPTTNASLPPREKTSYSRPEPAADSEVPLRGESSTPVREPRAYAKLALGYAALTGFALALMAVLEPRGDAAFVLVVGFLGVGCAAAWNALRWLWSAWTRRR